MKKLSAYFFIFLAIAVKSNGQDRFVLEGTIGKYPVVMKIEKRTATYFYKNRKQDIELEGENAGMRKLFFTREIFDAKLEKDIVSESISITMTGNGSSAQWKGSWKNAKGTVLPVNLRQIDTTRYLFSEVPDLGFENNEDRIYTKARLSGISFIKDSVVAWQQYQLQWLHEPLTKTELLQIKNGFSANILQKINKVLLKKSFENIEAFFQCTPKHDVEVDYGAAIHSYFISPEYISINQTVSYYCGGAHPDAGDISFTIDAVTGKEIESFDELFWFTGKKPLLEKDKGYYDYIMERAKSLVTILSQLYPAEMKKPASEDDCDYSNPEQWNFPSWYFTKNGLYIAATFPHAEMPCNFAEFPVIPYSVLKQYERKNK